MRKPGLFVSLAWVSHTPSPERCLGLSKAAVSRALPASGLPKPGLKVGEGSHPREALMMKLPAPALMIETVVSEHPSGSSFALCCEAEATGKGTLRRAGIRLLVPIRYIQRKWITKGSCSGFPGGAVVKNPPTNAGEPGFYPRWGRSPGGGDGEPLQSSCLENPVDGGAWWAAVPGVTESDTTEQAHTQGEKPTRPRWGWVRKTRLGRGPGLQILMGGVILSKCLSYRNSHTHTKGEQIVPRTPSYPSPSPNSWQHSAILASSFPPFFFWNV